MRKAASFKQVDVSRAVKGALAGGINVEIVEVSEGVIRIFTKGDAQRSEAVEVASIEAALGKLENGQSKNPLLRRSQR